MTKKRKITSHGDTQVVALIAFTSKKRVSKLKSLARARETTRTLYKDNHNNKKNKKCSLTMLRSENRPFSVVCICMHIQSCSLLFHEADHDKWCTSSLVNYTFSLGAFDKNMVNQARQCDEIIENGPTCYIEQRKAQLLNESTAMKSMNSAKTRQTAMVGACACTRQVQR